MNTSNWQYSAALCIGRALLRVHHGSSVHKLYNTIASTRRSSEAACALVRKRAQQCGCPCRSASTTTSSPCFADQPLSVVLHSERDISNVVRIKCADCADFDLCLDCFGAGVEVWPHKRSHRYRVVDNLSFPLFHPDWGVSGAGKGPQLRV